MFPRRLVLARPYPFIVGALVLTAPSLVRAQAVTAPQEEPPPSEAPPPATAAPIEPAPEAAPAPEQTEPPPPPPASPAPKKAASNTRVVSVAPLRPDTVEGLDEIRLRSTYPIVGVSREEFTKRPRNTRMGDVVNHLPGVFSGGDEHPGENKDTGIRGLSHHFVRTQYGSVQLPGIDVNRDFRLNRLSPLSVGSVLVLRAPPPEYESDGIAGRIVIIPRPIPEDSFTEAQTGFGVTAEPQSDATALRWNAAFAAGKRFNKHFGLNAFASLDRLPVRAQNRRIITNDGDGTLVEQSTTDDDKYWENVNLGADLGFFYARGDIHVRPMFLYLNEHREIVKGVIVPESDAEREDSEENKPRTNTGAELVHTHRVTDSLALEWNTAWHRGQEQKDKELDAFADPGPGFAFTEREIQDRKIVHWIAQAGSKATYRFEGFPNEVATGFLYRHRSYDSDNRLSAVDPAGSVTDTSDTEDNFELLEDYLGVFVQDTIEPIEGWSIMAGARLEYVDTRTESTFGDDIRGKSKGLDINPAVHTAYRIFDNLTVRGSVARMVNRPGYRDMAPTVEEGDETFTLGNVGLIPATAWNYEIGMEYRFRRRSLFGFAMFHKDIDDLVETIDTGEDREGKDVLQIENVGDGYARGIELDQRLAFGDLNNSLRGLTIWANETFLGTQVREKATGITREFTNQADFLVNVGLQYAIEQIGTDLSVSAKLQHDYKKVDSATDVTTTDGAWYMNGAIGQAIGPCRLAFEVQNILDTRLDATRRSDATTERIQTSVGRTYYLQLSLAL